MRRDLRVLLCAFLLAAAGLRSSASAETPALPMELTEQGSADELEAWRYLQQERLIRARELAEKILKRRPDSYVAHFIVGYVHHYGEADFPRALYHQRLALEIYERKHSRKPLPSDPWRWHARIFRELAQVHADLENHRERLVIIARYNELYDPDMIAEQAWSYMKMRRFPEARLAARKGLSAPDPTQTDVALNALCAIEFEAGNDGSSYEACRAALDHARQSHGRANAVDLTNFAEASRSLFRLDEAERTLLEAAKAPLAWYGNPWLELAELYTRQGRFAEGLGALKEIPRYRAKRPPHVRNSDRNEARRALAAYLLVVGRADDALRITDKALVMPDRRGHNSRDPGQDRAIVALLDHQGHQLAAQLEREKAAGLPFFKRWWQRLHSLWQTWQGWLSGQQAARLLGENDRLVGTLRIGTAESAITPPWLVGDLSKVVGPAVLHTAVDRARHKDRRPGAGAYYDAFSAEAALDMKRPGEARKLAQRALRDLNPSEPLLPARVHALAALASEAASKPVDALRHYDQAFQLDPGVLRRLAIALPVRLSHNAHPVAERVAEMLQRSPRFEVADQGLHLRVRAHAGEGSICLESTQGALIACSKAKPERRHSPEVFAQNLVATFHKEAFAPRVDLSQGDLNSLDGSNRVARDPREALFEGNDAGDVVEGE